MIKKLKKTKKKKKGDKQISSNIIIENLKC